MTLDSTQATSAVFEMKKRRHQAYHSSAACFPAGSGSKGPAVKQSSVQLLGVRSVQIGVMLFVLQQFGGINAVMYFSTQVFKEVCRYCRRSKVLQQSQTGHRVTRHNRVISLLLKQATVPYLSRIIMTCMLARVCACAADATCTISVGPWVLWCGVGRAAMLSVIWYKSGMSNVFTTCLQDMHNKHVLSA